MGKNNNVLILIILSVIGCDETDEINSYVGKSKWKIIALPGGRDSPAMDSGGNIYLNDNSDWSLKSISPRGEVIFKTKFERPVYGASIGKHNDVIIQSGNSIYSITNGEINWEIEDPDKVEEGWDKYYNLTIDSEGNIIYNTTKRILKIKYNSEIIWSAEVHALSRGPTGIIIGQDGTIYAGGSGSKLEAFSTEGKQLWLRDMGDSIEHDGIIDENGDVTLISENRVIYRVSKDGDIIGWGRGHVCDGPDSPTTAWGYVFFGANGAVSYRFPDPKHLCRYRVEVGEGEDIDLNPVLVDPGGEFLSYWGSRTLVKGKIVLTAWKDWHQAGVVATDIQGNIIWLSDKVDVGERPKWEDPSDDILVGPLVGPDGTVYVRTGSYLIAFEGDPDAVLEGGWPKFGHDAANSFNAARGLYE